MSKRTKKTESALFVRELESIFKCPICDTPMQVIELKRLICSNNHSFDFAKQGYINLLTHQMRTKYGKALFEARRHLIVEGAFFESLSVAIIDIIREQTNAVEGNISILDTGCGEGSHLVNVCDRLRMDYNRLVTGVGIDISKEGVLAAAKHYAQNVWCVSDLANPPFKNQQFHVILNILSPSNYTEFNRVLKDDGLVIKVVPGTNYLKELRNLLYEQLDKQSYTNVETVELFHKNFDYVECENLHYKIELNNQFMQSLVRMTPLAWAMSEDKVKQFLQRNTTEITVDLDILIGRKRIKL